MTPTMVSTENAVRKAARLLADGSVYVIVTDAAHTAARVRGDHGIYDVNWIHGGWACTCAAFGECSHIAAVRLVTTATLKREVP